MICLFIVLDRKFDWFRKIYLLKMLLLFLFSFNVIVWNVHFRFWGATFVKPYLCHVLFIKNKCDFTVSNNFVMTFPLLQTLHCIVCLKYASIRRFACIKSLLSNSVYCFVCVCQSDSWTALSFDIYWCVCVTLGNCLKSSTPCSKIWLSNLNWEKQET